MANYANLDAVQKRVPYRVIDTQSEPSVADVEGWLDQAEAELNGTLQAAQLPAPYTTPAAVLILGKIITDYAEGKVRQAYAAAGGDGDNDDGDKAEARFEKTLEDILQRSAVWGAKLGSGNAPSSSSKLRSHVRAGKKSKPWVTRDEKF